MNEERATCAKSIWQTEGQDGNRPLLTRLNMLHTLDEKRGERGAKRENHRAVDINGLTDMRAPKGSVRGQPSLHADIDRKFGQLIEILQTLSIHLGFRLRPRVRRHLDEWPWRTAVIAIISDTFNLRRRSAPLVIGTRLLRLRPRFRDLRVDTHNRTCLQDVLTLFQRKA